MLELPTASSDEEGARANWWGCSPQNLPNPASHPVVHVWYMCVCILKRARARTCWGAYKRLREHLCNEWLLIGACGEGVAEYGGPHGLCP